MGLVGCSRSFAYTHSFATTLSFAHRTKWNGVNNQILGLQQTDLCMGK